MLPGWPIFNLDHCNSSWQFGPSVQCDNQQARQCSTALTTIAANCCCTLNQASRYGLKTCSLSLLDYSLAIHRVQASCLGGQQLHEVHSLQQTTTARVRRSREAQQLLLQRCCPHMACSRNGNHQPGVRQDQGVAAVVACMPCNRPSGTKSTLKLLQAVAADLKARGWLPSAEPRGGCGL